MLCLVYNYAPHYRLPVFRAIEQTWECEWWFGHSHGSVKGMLEDSLQNAHYVNNKHLIGPLYWQPKVSSLPSRSDIDAFLILGEPFAISTWIMLLKFKLFHRQKPVYVWSHGWYGRENRVKKIIKRIFFGMAKHVFTYGQYAKDIAISQGFDGSKITPIHNSLDHTAQVKLREVMQPSDIYRKKFGNDNKTLIYIGRIVKYKRLEMLIDAMKSLPHCNLVIIGDGEARSELEKQVEENNLGQRVWFYGACYDEAENAQLIFNADLCVSPGNVGLTAMHTMVFGTPVVTHNDFPWQGPEFEAIHPGDTGEFFERGSVDSLAEAISRWFESHPDREAVRRACYDEIDSRWTPQYQVDVLRKIIH